MYNYTFAGGNPNGIEYTLQFVHDVLYTNYEFDTIVEEILNEYYIKAKYIMPTEAIIPIFESRGFRHSENSVAAYYLEPYTSNGVDTIKCPELQDRLNNFRKRMFI